MVTETGVEADVVLAVDVLLALDGAEFTVGIGAAPLDALAFVFDETVQADVVEEVPGKRDEKLCY